MMVYRWPSSLLTRLEKAIWNSLWTGDVNKKGGFRVSWAHCCVPIHEGGLGDRSIHLGNESFLCQFAWDLMTRKEMELGLLHRWYFDAHGNVVSTRRASFIWSGIRQHLPRLQASFQWSLGDGSLVSF